MAANRLDPTKAPEDTAEKKYAVAAPKKAGGGTWIPLMANIVLMPAIAYALTTFVLVPKIQGGKETAAEAHGAEGESGSHGGGGAKASVKGRVTVPLGGKVLVNVAGTAGTRYLVSTMSLVGKTQEFKDNVERNDPQLRDAAASILGSKTLADVDKPGMRNIIRAELISGFNDILGKESVIDIYLTEFAIQ